MLGERLKDLTEAQRKLYFAATTAAASQTFIERKTAGMTLSERVWNYAKGFKQEMELALDCGIRDGKAANRLATELKQYLRYPDKLFRRVRDEHGQLHLSKAAAAFHPGRGVYRSSYINARRLAATETNIAYHTADYERWQTMDFVLGIEIRLSNNHNCKGYKPGTFHDICDDLAGKYPKDFKFTGWHPHCRCQALPILKTPDDFLASLDDDNKQAQSKNEIKDVPQNFKVWFNENESRLQRATSLPYFLTDNPQYTGLTPRMAGVGGFTGTKLGRQATKEAMKYYANTKPPVLSAEQKANINEIAKIFNTTATPMTFSQADEGRANSGYGKSDLYSQNCQSSVVVHEARLRGLNITALPYSSSIASVQYRLGENTALAWRTAKGKTPTVTRLKGASDEELIRKLDKQMKAAGRYHIGVNLLGNQGHIIAEERTVDGKLFSFDTQNGKFLNIREFAAIESFEVLKVDKLLIAPDIIRAIARKI